MATGQPIVVVTPAQLIAMQGYRPLWETPIDALVAVMRYETPDGYTVLLPLDSNAYVYQVDDISLMRNTAQEAAAEAQLQQFRFGSSWRF